MRVFVFVNRVQEIGFRQTTALLIAAFHRQDHDVYLANVDSLTECNSTHFGNESHPTIVANAIHLEISNSTHTTSQQVANFAGRLQDSQFESIELQENDLIFIRTNPGRDLERNAQHSRFLDVCQVAKAAGIRVINDAGRLSFFASKAAIALLPAQYRPEMLVAQDLDSIVNFIRESDRDCVVKPLLGTRGNNVIRVNGAYDDLEQVLSESFRNQSLVVQHFIESQEPGDKRVVVLNGRILEQNGHLAGIHRLPAKGDFRSNLHAGGIARELKLSAKEREVVDHAAEVLLENGIQLAGIDIVGSRVIEFNVFSTGGLFDANRFARVDFTAMVAEALDS